MNLKDKAKHILIKMCLCRTKTGWRDLWIGQTCHLHWGHCMLSLYLLVRCPVSSRLCSFYAYMRTSMVLSGNNKIQMEYMILSLNVDKDLVLQPKLKDISIWSCLISIIMIISFETVPHVKKSLVLKMRSEPIFRFCTFYSCTQKSNKIINPLRSKRALKTEISILSIRSKMNISTTDIYRTPTS